MNTVAAVCIVVGSVLIFLALRPLPAPVRRRRPAAAPAAPVVPPSVSGHDTDWLADQPAEVLLTDEKVRRQFDQLVAGWGV